MLFSVTTNALTIITRTCLSGDNIMLRLKRSIGSPKFKSSASNYTRKQLHQRDKLQDMLWEFRGRAQRCEKGKVGYAVGIGGTGADMKYEDLRN
jgi:hypothetical protein